MDEEREFRDERDAVEFALGTALANVEVARSHLIRLTELVRDRADLDALRGALDLVRYAIEGVWLAVGGVADRGPEE